MVRNLYASRSFQYQYLTSAMVFFPALKTSSIYLMNNIFREIRTITKNPVFVYTTVFCKQFFILVVPCIVNLLYVSNQRDVVLSSFFIVLQNHSTCFGCSLHPSSGVHKVVVTTTGTSHVYR